MVIKHETLGIIPSRAVTSLMRLREAEEAHTRALNRYTELRMRNDRRRAAIVGAVIGAIVGGAVVGLAAALS